MPILRMFVCAVCLLGAGVDAAAAQPAGRLAGVVRDTTGNVLPGVRLTVTGGPPAASQTAVTDDDGRYALDSIPLGHYLVTGALGGFEPRTIAVDVDDDSTTLDLVLAVSSFSETMTVTATKTGAVDIDSTPIAVTVVPARTLEQLEIHTVEDLAGLVPAVTISQHTGGAGDHPRHRDEQHGRRCRSQLHRSSRRGLPRPAGDGAHGVC